MAAHDDGGSERDSIIEELGCVLQVLDGLESGEAVTLRRRAQVLRDALVDGQSQRSLSSRS